jgi:hypothetical protein
MTLATITQFEKYWQAMLVLLKEGYAKLIADRPLYLAGEEMFTELFHLFAAVRK